MSFVEVKALSRSFGDIEAVRDISFAFDRGDIFGFIGPNGAGKSTTMRILATLDLPSSGDCLIDGLSTVDDADAVRHKIGYMPDSYGAYPNMTVEEYLDFFARAYQLRGHARRRAVADTMDFCQLEGISTKLITTLSKGMKQRLCLGRCLIHDPEMLILDEPSAGLDPRARIEFRDLLKILAEQGKSIFISSHILSELEELCHGVAIIEQGSLVTTGNVKEMKAEIREKAQANKDTASEIIIEIQLSETNIDTEKILAEQPGLSCVDVRDSFINFAYAGNAADQAALLKRLVEAGLPICHFAGRDQNLEDVFLHMTEGKVQ